MCKLDCEHPNFNKPSEEQLVESRDETRKLILKKEVAFASTVGKKSTRTIEAHDVHIVGRTPLPNGERPYEYTVANSHGRIMTASVDEPKHWTEPMSSLTTDALRIGHRVSRIDGEHLRSGANTYTSAIVVSTDPFVLVSDDTTMKWQETVKASDFECCGYVERELVEKCRARLYE